MPFPWWTDACYFGFYGAILVALVSFFRPSLRLIGGQALLDGLLAVSALALLWWWLVLRDLTARLRRASLVGLSYPVLDLVLLCTIATTPLVSARRGTLAGWLVAAGVAAGGIADGVYTHLVLTDRYVSGGLVDLGWQLQACLICLAAVAAGARNRTRVELGPAPLAAADPDRGQHDRRAARDPARPRRRGRSRRAVRAGDRASSSSSRRCCSSAAGCS